MFLLHYVPSLAARYLGTPRSQREAFLTDWPTVWFKGGSESGVLTLGWLATNRDGETFVVEAMVSNTNAALSTNSITQLVALGKEAFGIVG